MRRRVRCLPAGLALLPILAAMDLFALMAPRPARGAADDAAPVAAAPARVEVVIVGPEPSSATLAAALTPLLSGDSRITWRRENTLPAGAGDARPSTLPSGVWIEATPNGAVRIVAITEHAPPAVRVVDGGAPSLTAEIVAQIVRETAVALLDRDEDRDQEPEAQADAGASQTSVAQPEQGPPPAPATTALRSLTREPREPIRLTYAMGLAYVSRNVFADNAFRGSVGQPHDFDEEGVGASLALLTPAEPFGLSAGVLIDRAAISTSPGGGNVGHPALDITRWSVRGMVGPILRFQETLEIGLAVGAGADRVAAEAGVTGGSAVYIPAARAALRLSILFPPSGLEITGAVTLDAKPRTLFTQTLTGGAYEIYGTTWFQPGFSIGLGWRR